MVNNDPAYENIKVLMKLAKEWPRLQDDLWVQGRESKMGARLVPAVDDHGHEGGLAICCSEMSAPASECLATRMQQHLLCAVASLYAHTEDPVDAESEAAIAAHLAQGSPLGEVARTFDSDIGRVVAVALSEVIYECRGALEYAEVDSPAQRLARRVIHALVPLAPEADENQSS